MLRALIRDGAASGAFDRELASDSAEAASFFASLRKALATGYFVEEDRDGMLRTVAVPGYVYLPDDPVAPRQVIGFGLFKARQGGYELWLAGVDQACRGHGHGRAMIAALLDTAPGRAAHVVRVSRFGRHSPAMAHLLGSFGYGVVRETRHHTWYLRHDAPQATVAELRALSAATGELH
jgi:GNAT superfamily N-acetyltransferase